MSNGYLRHIDDVAALHGIRTTYEDRLIGAWAGFETACKLLQPAYDVLDRRVGAQFMTRMSDFIRLLYENDDSSPTGDCDQIREKDSAYGGSWHSRGGTGAFHALARKGDRLISMLNKHGSLNECRKDKTNSESIDDTIGDLRRYLILVTAWHVDVKMSSVAETEAIAPLELPLPPPPIRFEDVAAGPGDIPPKPDDVCTCDHRYSQHDGTCLVKISKKDYCPCSSFAPALTA